MKRQLKRATEERPAKRRSKDRHLFFLDLALGPAADPFAVQVWQYLSPGDRLAVARVNKALHERYQGAAQKTTWAALGDSLTLGQWMALRPIVTRPICAMPAADPDDDENLHLVRHLDVAAATLAVRGQQILERAFPCLLRVDSLSTEKLAAVVAAFFGADRLTASGLVYTYSWQSRGCRDVLLRACRSAFPRFLCALADMDDTASRRHSLTLFVSIRPSGWDSIDFGGALINFVAPIEASPAFDRHAHRLVDVARQVFETWPIGSLPSWRSEYMLALVFKRFEKSRLPLDHTAIVEMLITALRPILGPVIMSGDMSDFVYGSGVGARAVREVLARHGVVVLPRMLDGLSRRHLYTLLRTLLKLTKEQESIYVGNGDILECMLWGAGAANPVTPWIAKRINPAQIPHLLGWPRTRDMAAALLDAYKAGLPVTIAHLKRADWPVFDTVKEIMQYHAAKRTHFYTRGHYEHMRRLVIAGRPVSVEDFVRAGSVHPVTVKDILEGNVLLLK